MPHERTTNASIARLAQLVGSNAFGVFVVYRVGKVGSLSASPSPGIVPTHSRIFFIVLILTCFGGSLPSSLCLTVSLDSNVHRYRRGGRGASLEVHRRTPVAVHTRRAVPGFGPASDYLVGGHRRDRGELAERWGDSRSGCVLDRRLRLTAVARSLRTSLGFVLPRLVENLRCVQGVELIADQQAAVAIAELSARRLWQCCQQCCQGFAYQPPYFPLPQPPCRPPPR